MNSILQMVENEQSSEFYPTPEKLVNTMLSGIDWWKIKTILEPSAGKGDILREVARRENIYKGNRFDIDCIEIDPNLRQILKYNFSDERKKGITNQIHDLEKFARVWNATERKYEDKLTTSQKIELRALEDERAAFFEKGIHIVHDNFLTYNPFKRYDLIIMNPPFSNGDRHLLKALKMQEKGGNIICLLNAETIKNPYTETRKELIRQLDKYDAHIEFIENAFTTAERKTGVEVALIKVAIEQVTEDSDIYKRFKEAEGVADINPDITDLEVTDYIKAAVNRFNIEAKAGLELIRQYRAMIPYMWNSFDEDDKYKKPILRLTDSTDRGYDSVSSNDYLKRVRMKYWQALLTNPKFIGRLTSKLQREYREKVDRLADYDFSEFNIYSLSAEINMQIKKGVEDEIITMFDRLTEEHSWYPETQKNRHYYDGWATNKAHKIGKKVIIPCYGVFDAWDGKPRTYNAIDVLADIERILNFLDGGMTQEIDLYRVIENHFIQGITKNIPLKFFKATFYKKGTVHLEFTRPELIDRFNIYAAQNKSWLPPSYGKKAYKDMTEKEKAVVDGFQGEEAYNKILANAKYYLAPVTNNQTLLLTAEV